MMASGLRQVFAYATKMHEHVYQRAPVSEFAPSTWRMLHQAERLARSGIRALRARQGNLQLNQ